MDESAETSCNATTASRRHAGSGGIEVTGPPRNGIPLGLRLGLLSGAVVFALMGLLVVVTQKRMAKEERRDMEALFGEAVSPLTEEVRASRSRAEVRASIERFVEAWSKRGLGDVRVGLIDASGGEGLSAGSVSGDGQLLHISMDVRLSFMSGRRATLEAWQEDEGLSAEIRTQTVLLLVDAGLTSVALLVCLTLAAHLLIGRPLAGLMRAVDRMEMGYWGDVRMSRGVWETRWLAWKFGRLGRSLERLVGSIVHADALGSHQGASTRVEPIMPGTGPAHGSLVRDLEKHELLSRLRRMEAGAPDDPEVRALARHALDVDVLVAERMGETGLKARLEDAAMKVVEPAIYNLVECGLRKGSRSRTQ
ncbi:MAG: hypothetical protein JRG91_11150, partial [Deltaproteobacteria bacterium]|nr:hypothetical protein [Deltaproteobacteria bacterium]